MLDDFKPVKRTRKIARLAEPKDYSDEPAEMKFKKPEEVAAADTTYDEPLEPQDKPKASRHRKRRHISLRQWLLIFGGVLVLATGSVAAWTMANRTPEDTDKPLPKTVYNAPPKTTAPSRLTGVEIPIADNELPTTAVQIENSPDARPQAGLYDAGIVTEAIAEGGITRFNAIYMEAMPKRIGPVRSLRPYYIDFFWPYDAAIAHAGGSAKALQQVRTLKLKDLDHGANGSTFYRDSNRYAPHNLYTSREALLKAQRARGYKTSTFTGLKRKVEAKAETPSTTKISVNISSFLYNPTFTYDAKTNSYLRAQAGKPHVDEKSGKQLNPKVVVVLVMSHHYDGIYSVYGTTGKGAGFVFQDGTATKITWRKEARNKQFTFTDTEGKEVALNPGQTWFTLAQSSDRVSY